jgi:hypothetical protein
LHFRAFTSIPREAKDFRLCRQAKTMAGNQAIKESSLRPVTFALFLDK